MAFDARRCGGTGRTGRFRGFQVNTHTLGYQSTGYAPRVGAAANGQFVVLWQDYPGYSISGRRFDSTGAPGIGISPHEHAAIFEPFHQADGSAAESTSARTGVPLWFVWNLEFGICNLQAVDGQRLRAVTIHAADGIRTPSSV
jgi:hypothetical protein